jgi:hypothetical protein
MLGDLDLIVETEPENAFTRRMRKGLGGGCNKVLAGRRLAGADCEPGCVVYQ